MNREFCRVGQIVFVRTHSRYRQICDFLAKYGQGPFKLSRVSQAPKMQCNMRHKGLHTVECDAISFPPSYRLMLLTPDRKKYNFFEDELSPALVMSEGQFLEKWVTKIFLQNELVSAIVDPGHIDYGNESIFDVTNMARETAKEELAEMAARNGNNIVVLATPTWKGSFEFQVGKAYKLAEPVN